MVFSFPLAMTKSFLVVWGIFGVAAAAPSSVSEPDDYAPKIINGERAEEDEFPYFGESASESASASAMIVGVVAHLS